MHYVDEASGASIADWQIGDRVWTKFYGTGTLKKLRLRASTGLKQDALVNFAGPISHSHWMVLVNLHRLEPDEPDRLPDGLYDVHRGDLV
jgi:hypothetical protein